MPVDAIQPYQIVIMAGFLLFLLAVLLFVRRFRGGLGKHLHRSRRIRHVEDLALTSQQRLHLVEVDGQTFMIHSGKGHAATMMLIGEGSETTPPMTLTDVQAASEAPAKAPAAVSAPSLKRQATASPVTRQPGAKPSGATKADDDAPRRAANVDQIASAIAEARRRNPSLGLGK